ncbi:MAG: hypothetical protein QOE64_2391 [Frankiales bacterium]|jgi:hypothetical protein|nr:hypothetical protein [Frankiales bacterium]
MTARMVGVAGSGSLLLLDTTPADLSLVAPYVDTNAEAVPGDPLLTVRFVDRLPRRELRLVGERHAVDDRALLMRSGAGWARLPLGDANAGDELVCERRVDEVPHLVDLLNLAALHRGALPLHAAALARDGAGVLLVGWSKGGKTEAVLARTARGDRLVADEWVHLDSQLTARALGYRMRIWAWQLAQAPHVAGRLSAKERRRLAAVGTLLRVAPQAVRSPLERRHGSYLRPEAAFPGQLAAAAVISQVVLLESHDASDVSSVEADAGLVAERAAASTRFERRGLMESYAALRYALPGISDSRLDEADAIELAMARERIGQLPARVVAHPYPVDLDRLGDVV